MNLPEHAMRAFSEAESLFASGDIERAITRIDEALPEFAGDVLEADALNNKGYYLLHRCKWEEAISCFEKAYLIDVTFAAVLNHLAWAALMLGNREGAMALMDLFEKQKSDYQALHFRNKALIHTLDKEYHKALESVKRAEEDDPYLPYMDIIKKANGVEVPVLEYHPADLQARFLMEMFLVNRSWF